MLLCEATSESTQQIMQIGSLNILQIVLVSFSYYRDLICVQQINKQQQKIFSDSSAGSCRGRICMQSGLHRETTHMSLKTEVTNKWQRLHVGQRIFF